MAGRFVFTGFSYFCVDCISIRLTMTQHTLNPCGKTFLFLLITCVGLQWISCNKHDVSEPNLAAVSYTNVAYGTDPLQDMDVYLPAGRDTVSTPLLILIHGGAWFSGDKSDFQPYVDSVKKLFPHYAMANVNYRLASLGVNLFPTQENDVNDAANFLLQHTAAYRISKKFIYVGASAGGQLALLQAYKYTSPRAVAVVSFFGPSDMADLYYLSPDTLVTNYLPLLMGGTPEQNPALYLSSSPIHYVSASSCPTLLLQGGKDELVPPQDAFRLNDTLQTLGVAHELDYYPDEGHGWFGANLHDSFNKIKSFLDKHVP